MSDIIVNPFQLDSGPAPVEHTLVQVPGPLFTGYNLNGAPFISDNLATDGVGATQAVIYYSRGGLWPMVAHRDHGSATWNDLIDMPSADANDELGTAVLDAHNTISMGFDSSEAGHFSGNMHTVALKYQMYDLGTGWTNPAMVGTLESSVTYPKFQRLLNDDLLFMYRDGSSGNGDLIVNRRASASSTWARQYAGPLLQGKSTDSPYWGLGLDNTSGTLHLFWMWRGDPLTADSNHDICYARSEDSGATWEKSDGTAYTLPITPASAEILVATAATGSGLLNDPSVAVDSSGNPHCAFIIEDGSGYSQIKHLWHNGTAWQEEFVTSFTDTLDLAGGLPAIPLSRPMTVCWPTGEVWIVYRTSWASKGGYLRAIDVTTPGSPSEQVLVSTDLGEYEPSHDKEAMRTLGELHMLVSWSDQDLPTRDTRPGYVLEVTDPDNLAVSLPGAETDPPPDHGQQERFWMGSNVNGGYAVGDKVWAIGNEEDTDNAWFNGKTSAPNATDPVSTKIPLLATPAALNSKPAVSFDGVDDWLAVQFAADDAQPITYSMVINIRSLPGSAYNFMDGDELQSTTQRHLIGISATQKWNIYAGTLVTSAASATTGAHLLVCTFNGASSVLYVDGTSVLSGNAGTQAGRRVRLGTSYNGLAAAPVDIAFYDVYNGTLGSTARSALRTWAQSYYGTP